LLTTSEVARLLRVHPKHIYRLLKRGLPARRVGGEWRYEEAEILDWARGERPRAAPPTPSLAPPPLLAANGDLALEALLDEARADPSRLLGFVQADHATGLIRLERGAVLVAGCHLDNAPTSLGGEKLAWIHLVERELGIAHQKGARMRLTSVARRRLASRPKTAGIRVHIDEALRREGLDPETVHAGAKEHLSHRDAVMAVVRGDADVALASRAWAAEAGLGFTSVVVEPYGLVLRAEHLGDPRIIALCEIAQSGRFRARLASLAGYDASRAGSLKLGGRS